MHTFCTNSFGVKACEIEGNGKLLHTNKTRQLQTQLSRHARDWDVMKERSLHTGIKLTVSQLTTCMALKLLLHRSKVKGLKLNVLELAEILVL